MRINRTLIVSIVLSSIICLLLTDTLSAAEKKWRPLIELADSLHDAGNADSALAIGILALSNASSDSTIADTALARVYYRAALYYDYASEFVIAESLYIMALTSLEEIHGKKHPSQLEILRDLSWTYFYVGRLEEAEQLLITAVEILELSAMEETKTGASIYHTLGSNLQFQAKYQRSEKYHLKALKIRRAILGGKHEEIAATLTNIGKLQMSWGNYGKAEQYIIEAIEISDASRSPYHPSKALLSFNLSVAYEAQGKYLLAKEAIEKSLTIAHKAYPDGHIRLALYQVVLGSLLSDAGDWETAESLLVASIGYTESTLGKDFTDLGQAYTVLADIYFQRGRYRESERYFKRALDIYSGSRGKDHPTYASALNNLAVLYYELGRQEEAQKLYNQSMKILETLFGSSHPMIAEVLMNLSRIRFASGDVPAAESLLTKSLVIWEDAEINDNLNVVKTLQSMARIYLADGRLSEAREAIAGSDRRLARSFSSVHPVSVVNFNVRAQIAIEENDSAEAGAAIRQALTAGEQSLVFDHQIRARSFSIASTYFELVNEHEQALHMAARACRMWRRIFTNNVFILSERDALSYAMHMREALDRYLSIFRASDAMDDRECRVASELILLCKGEVSDEIFERSRYRNVMGNIDDEGSRLVFDLRYTKKRLAEVFAAGPEEPTPDGFIHQLDSLTNEIDALEGQLVSRSSIFRDRDERHDLTVDELIDAMPGGTSLIEYVTFKKWDHPASGFTSWYAASVINSAGIISFVKLGSRAIIDSLIDRYRKHFRALSVRSNLPDAANLKEYLGLAKDLYQKIWLPLEKFLETDQTVFIAPSGGLGLVSFSGLVDSQDRFLLRAHTIHYLSSSRDVLRTHASPSNTQELFALGDPDYNHSSEFELSSLPDSMASADDIEETGLFRSAVSDCGAFGEIELSRLLGTRYEILRVVKLWEENPGATATVYLGKRANETNFKRYAGNHTVIHLATHGFFLEGKCQTHSESHISAVDDRFLGENPLLLSGLFLAGANSRKRSTDGLEVEDGILTAEEISALDLTGTRLVILSACESGVGRVEDGEGLYGLRRAFQMAGASSIVSSLWAVPDKATTVFMKRLYQATDETLPARLRTVQLETLDEELAAGRPGHPFTWGGFISFGDWHFNAISN